AMIEILGVNLGHRQTMLAKVAGELEERDVLFAHVVKNADRSGSRGRETNDSASRSAKLALQGLNLLHGQVKMLLKEFGKNVHEVRLCG
ncbi:MAG TPA: hypothetical protein VH350_11450, partial [Candidatus Sulfotelmatobacter sp.]|nr:hypothetical protein [Candidatus Sulfotelmatobacter sp.]